MTGTHQLNGLFHFLSTLAYRCKNPGYPMIMIFSIFPGGKFAQLRTFSVVGDWNLFSGIIFFQEIEIIYSRAYWFLKIWLSMPEWIKNGTSQCMGLVNKSLLADLMMILN